MAITINDPETERLARELAEREQVSVELAVRLSLEQKLASAFTGDNGQLKRPRTAEEREEILARVREIQDEIAKLPKVDPRSPHEIMADLYDEYGLPK